MFSGKKQNCLYIEQKFGGHLGFYEGGILYPGALTWLDRVVVDCVGGLVAYTDSGDAEKVGAGTSASDSEEPPKEGGEQDKESSEEEDASAPRSMETFLLKSTSEFKILKRAGGTSKRPALACKKSIYKMSD